MTDHYFLSSFHSAVITLSIDLIIFINRCLPDIFVFLHFSIVIFKHKFIYFLVFLLADKFARKLINISSFCKWLTLVVKKNVLTFSSIHFFTISTAAIAFFCKFLSHFFCAMYRVLQLLLENVLVLHAYDDSHQ